MAELIVGGPAEDGSEGIGSAFEGGAEGSFVGGLGECDADGVVQDQLVELEEVLLLAALAKLTPLALPTLGWLLSVSAGVGCVLLAWAVAKRLGPAVADWRWEKLHRLPMNHVLASRGDLAELFNYAGMGDQH